jgi:hypothetical protein
MLEIYPDRANPGSLWGGANKAKELAHAAKCPMILKALSVLYFPLRATPLIL